METKQYTTLAVGLIVAVVLVSGLMVPVISSLSDSGGDGNESAVIRNTNPMYNDGLPMWTIPDSNTNFKMYFDKDAYSNDTLQLYSSDPVGVSDASPYYSSPISDMISYRGPIVVLGEGFITAIWWYNSAGESVDGTFWVFTVEGGSEYDSIEIVGTMLVAHDGQGGTTEYPDVYGYIGENPTHFFTDYFYFINSDGEEDYLPPYITESTIFTAWVGLPAGVSAISHGTLNNLESSLVSDAWEPPIPSISNESLEIEYYAIEDNNALRLNQMIFDISFDVEGYGNVNLLSEDTDFPSTDGKLDLIYDYDTMDTDPVQVNFLVPAEITVGSGSGSGEGNSGLSPTLTTLLSVIPLITVIGIIIGVIGYLRFKE